MEIQEHTEKLGADRTMRRFRHISLTLAVGILAAAFFSDVANACTITVNPEQVGSSFRVRVLDRGHAVPALELELRPFSLNPNVADVTANRVEVTDAQGYAEFSNIPAGSYYVRASHDPPAIDDLSVDVAPTSPENKTLSLTWPSSLAISVQSAAGTLRSTNFYPRQFQDQLSLSLLDGRTGRVIATTVTDKTGRFAFEDSVGAGIYFIQIAEPPYVDGAIAIEVRRRAKFERMDLYISNSGCGLMYSRRQPTLDITAREICGDVTDTSRAAVSRAGVWLFSNDGDRRIIESTKTDGSGHFALAERQDGVYQLAIQRSGFVPYVVVVHLHSAAASDVCAKPFKIKLGLD